MNERELQDAVEKLPKSIEPPHDLWPGIEARIGRAGGGRRAWTQRWYWVPLAAAAVLVLFLLGRRERNTWDIITLAGRPVVGQLRLTASGRLHVGDWVQTDDSSRALIAVGKIGQLEVRPDTRCSAACAISCDASHGGSASRKTKRPRLRGRSASMWQATPSAT